MPRVLRDRSWIHYWEEYMSDTESPAEFNTWCAISTISATLKRNVWIDRGKFILYPNTYIILISPPGIGKGTAINPVLELLNDSNTANIMSDRVTAEKVIERLSDGWGTGTKVTSGKVAIVSDRSCLIAATELPIYLNSSVWTMELMCDLWDNKPGGISYSTKTKSSFAAKDTCVSLIGGCVPDYIRKLNREAMTAITGGFTSRCIFVFGGEKSKLVAWPSTNGTYGKLKADLINDLQHITTLTGQFKFSPQAIRRWEQYYQINFSKQDPFESEVVMGFKARMMAHIFKTSMCLSVAEKDDLIISETQLGNAIGLVEKVRDRIDIVFRCVGESSLAMAQDRVLTFIDREGIVSRGKILRYLGRHITDDDLTKVLRVLVGADLVREVSNVTGNTHSISYESTKVKGFQVKKP
jgi:Protein of unknown function (DUF3987)